jgi:hypothetical protein
MAWQLLLTREYGQFSLFVIAFVVAMAVWFSRYFKRKMAEDEKQANALKSSTAAGGNSAPRPQ